MISKPAAAEVAVPNNRTVLSTIAQESLVFTGGPLLTFPSNHRIILPLWRLVNVQTLTTFARHLEGTFMCQTLQHEKGLFLSASVDRVVFS